MDAQLGEAQLALFAADVLGQPSPSEAGSEPEPAPTVRRTAHHGHEMNDLSHQPEGAVPACDGVMRNHPSSRELLETPGALLTRTRLREFGLERRAVDAVFRTLAVVLLPGYSRPMIRAEEFLELVEQCTYRDDRVRPCGRAA